MKGWGAVLAAAAAGLAAPQATAEPVEPRQTAIAIAERIEERFFDPERARSIGGALRAEAADGRYDAFTDPHDLANALTERLRGEDRHFRVEWVGEGPPQGAGPQPQHDRHEIAARRSGYGFRRVEILPGNLGYIDLRGFMPIDFSDPQWPVRQAADAALALVSRTDAVIFDLRDNGGGAPSMVGYLASAFVPADSDVYNVFHSREGTRSEAPDEKYSAPMTAKPVYVLVSARTGSAAEAFAYTLQAAGRATVVGEPTAGAANPGGTVPTGTGFAIFISDASPKNPITGGNWETKGVVPEVEVPAADALAEARRRALRETVPALPAAERTEAEWALAALEADAPPQADLAALAGDYGAVSVALGADGLLELRRGRRPPVRLRPLARDLFFAEDHPGRRVAFERGADGRPAVLELRYSDGEVSRHRRG